MLQLKHEVLVAANVLSQGETMPRELANLTLSQIVQYAISVATTQSNGPVLCLIVALALTQHIESQQKEIRQVAA